MVRRRGGGQRGVHRPRPGRCAKPKLIELRATGRQTVVAPSKHPDGDVYVWHDLREPARLDAGALRAAVARRRRRRPAGAALGRARGPSTTPASTWPADCCGAAGPWRTSRRSSGPWRGPAGDTDLKDAEAVVDTNRRQDPGRRQEGEGLAPAWPCWSATRSSPGPRVARPARPHRRGVRQAARPRPLPPFRPFPLAATAARPVRRGQRLGRGHRLRPRPGRRPGPGRRRRLRRQLPGVDAQEGLVGALRPLVRDGRPVRRPQVAPPTARPSTRCRRSSSSCSSTTARRSRRTTRPSPSGRAKDKKERGERRRPRKTCRSSSPATPPSRPWPSCCRTARAACCWPATSWTPGSRVSPGTRAAPAGPTARSGWSCTGPGRSSSTAGPGTASGCRSGGRRVSVTGTIQPAVLRDALDMEAMQAGPGGAVSCWPCRPGGGASGARPRSPTSWPSDTGNCCRPSSRCGWRTRGGAARTSWV